MITATLLRGKRKGKTVELHQFCNDWATLEGGGVVSLVSLECGDDAIAAIMNAEKRGRTGIMFDLYDLRHFADTGRFKRRPIC